MISAAGFPSPNTVWVRVLCNLHFVHLETSSAINLSCSAFSTVFIGHLIDTEFPLSRNYFLKKKLAENKRALYH
ncbi:hypothetical protein LEP1GSC058_3651 [Leptospira fainei serovar Hurstbridge str. BUT 6]|uniref:Uncharacterized protein n=1 Tax=Leptospira fainei serovar Hurstbridge str. BUT 6 TaxID=1193011 RepID=S3USS3_9LEPT|nr:hypothetical protein LEP1GSC058_3651 [Leptospira fainei serovar Hurstbridge str. BUT 6]